MAELAEAAVQRGLSVITFTDHVDLDDSLTGKLDGYSFTAWPDMLEDFCKAHMLWGDKVELRLGIELGEPNHHRRLRKKSAILPALTISSAPFTTCAGRRISTALNIRTAPVASI
jgi:histidinol phosphatase-like PHP family hydrolase